MLKRYVIYYYYNSDYPFRSSSGDSFCDQTAAEDHAKNEIKQKWPGIEGITFKAVEMPKKK